MWPQLDISLSHEEYVWPLFEKIVMTFSLRLELLTTYYEIKKKGGNVEWAIDQLSLTGYIHSVYSFFFLDLFFSRPGQSQGLLYKHCCDSLIN